VLLGNMSNNYFRFKEFTVHQSQCAMKVTTDACIQGAWATMPPDAHRVLDIGSGTGLLSFMLAQRYKNIIIDAVEIDNDAATQAQANINESPFASRIQLFHTDAKKFSPLYQYDFIISNPPFFLNSLQSAAQNRTIARHDVLLTQKDILNVTLGLLAENGVACFLWPYNEHLLWEQLITTSGMLYLQRQLLIKDNPQKPVKRVVSIWSRKENNPQTETLIIKEMNEYSQSFIQLMQPYYLYL
jgi:tRNA1Val (adenine37-N6)-methyltransferase